MCIKKGTEVPFMHRVYQRLSDNFSNNARAYCTAAFTDGETQTVVHR
ncbi:hypothetical protein EDC54_1201, partial [Samsonia erythrinae]